MLHRLCKKGELREVTIEGIPAPFYCLEEAVHFYNSRDVDPAIPKPEVPMNVNKDELGNLKLTPQEEADIVAFLKTLTDGYK